MPTATSPYSAPSAIASAIAWPQFTRVRRREPLGVACVSGAECQPSLPFAITCVRSANAIVICARCSTSRIETPRSRIPPSVSNSARRPSGRGRATARRAAARRAARRARARSRAAAAGRPRARPRAAGRSRATTGKSDSTHATSSARPSRLRRAGEAEPQVLVDGQRRVDVPALGHERDAEPRDALRAEPAQRAAVQPDVAARRPRRPSPRGASRTCRRRSGRRDRRSPLRRPRGRCRAPRARPRSAPRAPRGRAPPQTSRPLPPRYAFATSMFCRISSGVPSASVRPWSSTWMRSQTSHDQRHVVVDQQHAGPVLVAHRAYDRGEVGHLGLGEPGRRLVHQHEARLGRERARNPELALVAVRQRRRRLVRTCRRARARRADASRARRASRAGGADAERGNLDVLAHRQPLEGVPVLERAREPGAAAPLRRPARDVALRRARRARPSGSRSP